MRIIYTLVAALVAITLAPAASAGEPVRVLAHGDSVTSGWRGDYTWRYFFSTARPDVDMVGNKTGTTDWGNWNYTGDDAYADPNFDQGHAATFGGRLGDDNPQPEWGQLRIGDLVRDYQPSAVVGLWGINDLNNGDSPETLAANYAEWITEARAQQPDVDFIIGALPQTWRANVPEFNALLPDLAAMSTEQSKVVIARAEGFAESDTVDGIHPTIDGQRKIAAMMLDALAVLETPAEPVPVPVPAAPVAPVAVPTPPVVTTPAALAKPVAPRGVKAVRHGKRVKVSWRKVAGESYAVRCGARKVMTTGSRVKVRSAAARCSVRSQSESGRSPWVKVTVKR